MSDYDDDLTLDIELRAPNEVAARLVVLSGLIQVALTFGDDEPEFGREDSERADLIDGLRIGQASEQLAPSELALLAMFEAETAGEEAVLSVLWQTEALNALSWAASLVPALGDPWRQAELGAIAGSVPAPWDEIDQFTGSIRLRSEEEIASARETAELWAWRSALEPDLLSAGSRERSELLSVVRETSAEAAAADLIGSSGDDFRVRNQPYARADAETQAVIAEVSVQRLRALNWLCGYGATWDDVPLDV